MHRHAVIAARWHNTQSNGYTERKGQACFRTADVSKKAHSKLWLKQSVVDVACRVTKDGPKEFVPTHGPMAEHVEAGNHKN